MGRIRTFTCPSCQRSWEVNIGHGIHHATPDNVLKAFPQDLQDEIQKTVAAGKLPHFQFDYHAALCSQCGEIISVPVIIFPETAQTIFPSCPACDSHVILLSEDSTPVCPQCKAAPLSIQTTGRWD